VLIRLASKATYGLYSQMFVAGIFAATVIDALITGPLTTIAPGKSPTERQRLANVLLRFQWQLSLALAVLGGVLSASLAAATGVEAHPVWLGLAFALYIFTNAQREYHRSISFIEARPMQVLHTDLRYALATVLGMALLLFTHNLTVTAVLLIMGLANLVGMWQRIGREPVAMPASGSEYRAAVGAVMQRGRWALPGALVAWTTNYSYLYLAALSAGVAASADLNASRLLLMPIALSVLAWSRVARPLVSRLQAARDWPRLDRLAWISVLGIELFTLSYVVLLWLALPWLQTHVLGAKYHGLEPMVMAWSVYFAINAARWIGSSWLTSGDQYKLLLARGVAGLLLMLAMTALFIARYGSAWGVIMALIVVETFDLLVVWTILLPMLRRKQS